jgi:hypothetical protein
MRGEEGGKPEKRKSDDPQDATKKAKTDSGFVLSMGDQSAYEESMDE